MRKMRLSFRNFFIASVILSFILLTQLISEISSPTEFKEQSFDIIKYDVKLDLSKAPQERYVIGKCDIYFIWTKAEEQNKLYLHLDLKELEIDSAIYKNNKIILSLIESAEDNSYYEFTEDDPTIGDTNKITIYYRGWMTQESGSNPWGGVTNDGEILFAIGVGFSNSYVSATRHWMPCYDHPSDKALFRGEFKVKKGLFVASNGELVNHIENDDYDIFILEHNYPVSTYLLTFAVSEFVPVEFQTKQPSVPMIIYTQKAYEEKVKSTFKLLPEMLKAYEAKFGPYPFEKIGYVMTPIGSMEHQTMISYDINALNYYYTIRDSMNATAAHELSHQWFGNLVTCRDFRDAWLNEGFATYCEPVWYEYMFGYDRYLRTLNNIILRYINSISKMEGAFPLYDYPRKPPSSNYPATIYFKGAAVIAMLRYELGDEIFYEAVREYLTRFAYSTATTELMKQTFEEVSKKDLNQFFEQWIYGKGFPMINIIANQFPMDNYYNLRVKINQVQPTDYGIYKGVNIELEFVDDNNQSEYRLIRLDSASQEFYFEKLGNIRNIRINTGNKLRSLVQILGVDIYTSVAENSSVENFHIYPIPVDNELVIHSHESFKGVIKIFDIWGAEKIRINRDSLLDDSLIKIDVSDFIPGLYILYFSNGLQIHKQLFPVMK